MAPIIVSPGAAAVAAAAAARRRAECKVFVRGYEHDRATVSEMREYAECIDCLYPAPMSSGELYAAKFAILVLFAAVVIGAFLARHGDGVFGPIESMMIGGIGGFLFGFVVLLAMAGVWFGVKLLLT